MADRVGLQTTPRIAKEAHIVDKQANNKEADIPIGFRFGEGGRYEIRERIGRGGMADVYRTVDTQLNNRLYAVKILSSATEASPNAEVLRALFLEEARALSRIRDNNVVAVITNGRLNDSASTPYMVMEYLDGQDLNGLLKANALERNERQLPVERAVDIILAVCAGVDACHLAGVIHRDLKPANIFLDRTLKGEEPKVLDFSVAKIPISRDQTKTDMVVGTESYMAPEQANGRPADERSDQYSIGAMLYRCLTGRVPRGFLVKPREIRSELPEDLEASLLRAMDPAPERRFPSVHEFGRSLLPHASATGRAKWTHYYTTPPVALRPAFTGPVAMSMLPLPDAPITAAVPPTRLDTLHSTVNDQTTRLVVEGVPSFGPASLPSPQESSSHVAPVSTPHSGASKASSVDTSPWAPRMPMAQGRGRLPLAIGVLALLALVGVLVFVLRRHPTGVDSPVPPSWTRSPAPPAVAPLPERPPAPPVAATPAPAGPDIPAPPVPSEKVDEGPPATRPRTDEARGTAVTGQAKKKRRQHPAPDALQRTRERLPVLP